MIDIGTLKGFLELDDNASAKLLAFKTNLESAGQKFDAITQKLDAAGGTLTKYITVPLAGAAAGIVMAGNDFTRTMNQVQAVTDAGAGDFKRLQAAALEWGQKTQFSANEAADAMLELGKAGFSTDATIAALPSTLQLAAAANMSLGDAANLTSNVMKTFGLSTTDLAHANDILAKAANESTIEVVDLREAFKYVGPVAAQAKVSLAQTSAAMALMGEAGIKGSMAGTSLRNVITTLMSPTDKQAGLMKELGLQGAYANGKLIGLDEIVRRIQASGKDASLVLELFGDRAGPGMAALVQKGATALANMTAKLDAADGAAKKMADASMKGLPGAIENLKGSIETLGTALYGVLEPAFLRVTQAIQGVVDFLTNTVVPAFAALPETVQLVAVGFLAVAAAAGPMLLALSGGLKVWGALTTGFGVLAEAVGVVMPLLTSFGELVLAIATGPIGLLVAGVGVLVAALWYFDVLDDVVGWFTEFWSILTDIGTIVVGVAGTIGDFALGALKWLINAFVDVERWILKAEYAVASWAAGLLGIDLGAVITKVVDFGKAVGTWIADKIEWAWGKVQAFAHGARQLLGGLADMFRSLPVPEVKSPAGFGQMKADAAGLQFKGISAADAQAIADAGNKAATASDRFSELGKTLTAAKTELAGLSTTARTQLAEALKSGAFSMEDLEKKTGLSSTALKLFKDRVDAAAKSSNTLKETLKDVNEINAKVAGAKGFGLEKVGIKLDDGKGIDAYLKQLDKVQDINAKIAGAGAFGLEKVGVKLDTKGIEQQLSLIAERASNSMKAIFGRAFQGFPGLLQQALTGGGGLKGAAQSLMSNIGSGLGEKLMGSLAGKASGFLASTLGVGITGALGTILPGVGAVLGSLAGPLIGKITGGIGKLFGNTEEKKINPVRQEFIDAAGGLAVLNQKAAEAGVTVKALLDAKTVKEYEKAVKDLNNAFEFQSNAMKTLDETAKKYGFTIDELGPAFARQQLDKQAQELFADFKVLTAAGVDVDTVLGKMGGSINDFVRMALKTGTEIPVAMAPMLQRMVEMGQLTDENGNVITDLEGAGVHFAMTMSEGFTRMIDEVKKLTDAISRGLGLAIDNIPQPEVTGRVRWDIDPLPGGEAPEPDPRSNDAVPMAEGGLGEVRRPTLFLVGERGPEQFAFSGANRRFKDVSFGGQRAQAPQAAPSVTVQLSIASVEGVLSDTDLVDTMNRKVVPLLQRTWEDNINGARTRTQEALGIA